MDMARHGQTRIALYTELDAECDQQLVDGVVQSTALGRVHRHQVLSTTDRRCRCLYRARRRSMCRGEMNVKSRVWDKLPYGTEVP